MNKLADRLNRLSPSATLAMSQKSQELKAQGIDVINMSVGEPDFNTPDNIKSVAKKAIDDNWSRYSPEPGYPSLRKAIVEKLKESYRLDWFKETGQIYRIEFFINKDISRIVFENKFRIKYKVCSKQISRVVSCSYTA